MEPPTLTDVAQFVRRHPVSCPYLVLCGIALLLLVLGVIPL